MEPSEEELEKVMRDVPRGALALAALKEFNSGARKNDIYSRMRSVAAALSESEIEGLAASTRRHTNTRSTVPRSAA